MNNNNQKTINMAIFVSGGGTNFKNIVNYFSSRKDVHIKVCVSNTSDAYALVRAEKLGIPSQIITRKEFSESPEKVMTAVNGCDYIILAGFLVKVPIYLLEAFPQRIINIHPALLPKYGGKGMWGHHIHEAVKAAGEKETGITIHFVNDELDRGDRIAQFYCSLAPEDTPDDIAAKIHILEQTYFPIVIDNVISKQKTFL